MKILDSPTNPELLSINFKKYLNGNRRQKGGMSTHEYEEMHGTVTAK